jgi:hypothetical protein
MTFTKKDEMVSRERTIATAAWESFVYAHFQRKKRKHKPRLCFVCDTNYMNLEFSPTTDSIEDFFEKIRERVVHIKKTLNQVKRRR